jgi:cbb3-type cytochrome oxidase cytochrome c subunit
VEKKLLLRMIIILLCLSGAGCSENETVKTADATRNRGEEVFALLACRACHSLTGQEGKKGPSLGRVGQSIPVKAIQEQLQTPRRRHPASRMPSFAFVRSDDFQALLDYLTSLK